MEQETIRGNWGEPIRAVGEEAIRIATEESLADEPLRLCWFSDAGDLAGGAAGILPSDASTFKDKSRIYLPIGRVGWCVIGEAFGTERIVEGPFATHDEAYCKLAMWSAARAKAGYAQVQVDFFVGVRHTPETFWQMVRRLDAERQKVKAARSA